MKKDCLLTNSRLLGLMTALTEKKACSPFDLAWYHEKQMASKFGGHFLFVLSREAGRAVCLTAPLGL